MSKNNISDFVILGGGCSALSFINQVIEQNITKYSFIIIEKQKKYVDDKSWCFWAENIKKNKNVIEASWSSFSFNLDNSTNFLSSINFKYYYIRSIKFYESNNGVILSPGVGDNGIIESKYFKEVLFSI